MTQDIGTPAAFTLASGEQAEVVKLGEDAIGIGAAAHGGAGMITATRAEARQIGAELIKQADG